MYKTLVNCKFSRFNLTFHLFLMRAANLCKLQGWTSGIVNVDILCRYINQLCQVLFLCLPNFQS